MSSTLLTSIEEELSLAYLHAVCARAGMSCLPPTRKLDNSGVDALLHKEFSDAIYPQESDSWLEIQMKATKKHAAANGEGLSYWLKEVKRYDVLRDSTRHHARILVVLFLPEDPETWLSHSEEELILRRCAYWKTLRGDGPISTNTGANIKLPKSQCFSPKNLQDLMFQLSLGKFPQNVREDEVS
ncbi:hypothetical protein IAD21_02232 [Abditibacteriota bacterium]|nr:hypothetical protein IAD21_02232 [Abditibacteriota bacterium]